MCWSFGRPKPLCRRALVALGYKIVSGRRVNAPHTHPHQIRLLAPEPPRSDVFSSHPRLPGTQHIGDTTNSVGLGLTHEPEGSGGGDGHLVPVSGVECPHERCWRMSDLVIMHLSPHFLWETGTGKVEFDYQCHNFPSVRVERRRSSRTNLVSEPKSLKSPYPLYPYCRLLISLPPPLWC